MPIKGKTDGQARWPVIGKLRKGSERGSGGTMGKELPYFRFTSDRPEVVTAFENIYGKQPAMLDVVLPYADMDEVFPSWLEEWDASGLVHRCDGETMVLWLSGKGYNQTPKPCPYCNGTKPRTKKEPGCKQIGRLYVVLPELVKAGYPGTVVIETHSDHDLRHIAGVLKTVMNGPRGLMGVRCKVWRAQEEISIPNYSGEGRVKAKKWLVKIAPDAAYVVAQLEATARLALAGASTVAMADGRAVDPTTGEIMAPSSDSWGDDDDEGDEVIEAEVFDKDAALKNLTAAVKGMPVNYGDFGAAVKAAYNVKAATELTAEQIKAIAAKLGTIDAIAVMAKRLYEGDALAEHIGWLREYTGVARHPIEATPEKLASALEAIKWVDLQAKAQTEPA